MLDRRLVSDLNRLIRDRRAQNDLPPAPTKPQISASRGVADAEPTAAPTSGGAGLVSPLTRTAITEQQYTVASADGACEIQVAWAVQRTYTDAEGTEIVFIDPLVPSG